MNILEGTLQSNHKCTILWYLIYIVESFGRNPSSR